MSKIRFQMNQENYMLMPTEIFAYWFSDAMVKIFKDGVKLKTLGNARQGMATSDNNRFLRLWYEVANEKIGLNYKNAIDAKNSKLKWFPYNKGGEYRKWYGNQEYVINYENDGYEVKKYATDLYRTPTRTIKSISEYFKPSISWSKISSGNVAFRYYPCGFVFDVAGCCIFYEDELKLWETLGFVNTNVCQYILKAMSPTLNYEAGQIAMLPILDGTKLNGSKDVIVTLDKSNIEICKKDWDSFETSWEFKKHPLI